MQYWDSHEKLYAYASAPQASHRPAWTRFNQQARRGPGVVGIWHETFQVAVAESIYVGMPRSGLAAVTSWVPVGRRADRAVDRYADGLVGLDRRQHDRMSAPTAIQPADAEPADAEPADARPGDARPGDRSVAVPVAVGVVVAVLPGHRGLVGERRVRFGAGRPRPSGGPPDGRGPRPRPSSGSCGPSSSPANRRRSRTA